MSQTNSRKALEKMTPEVVLSPTYPYPQAHNTCEHLHTHMHTQEFIESNSLISTYDVYSDIIHKRQS